MDEAYAALARIAEINGTHMPCRSLTLNDASAPLSHGHGGHGESDHPISDFWKGLAHEYRALFSPDRFPLLYFLMGQWFFGGFAYSSVVLYQGDILGGKTSQGPCRFDYGFNIIVGASEIAGGFIMRPFIDRPQYFYGGRRGTQMVGFLFCGIGVIMAGFSVYPVLIWACLARALINGATGVQTIQGPEVIDVSVRGTGSGFLNTVSLIGSTICSYWVYAPYSQTTIALGLALVIFTSGVFTYFIPETALTDLDTADIYEIGGDGKLKNTGMKLDTPQTTPIPTPRPEQTSAEVKGA
jgi:hypothetical protein